MQGIACEFHSEIRRHNSILTEIYHEIQSTIQSENSQSKNQAPEYSQMLLCLCKRKSCLLSTSNFKICI